MRGRGSCAKARGLRPLFFLCAALLFSYACARGRSSPARCNAGALLGAGGGHGSMLRTVQELGLREDSPEVGAFLCYCDALMRRDVRSNPGLVARERPALLSDYGAQEFKRLKKAQRRPVLRLLEAAALAGLEPCDAYALEALLRLDKDRFEALASESSPGSPAMKEKAEVARRRVGGPKR